MSNKQLSNIDAKEARRRWEANLPVNLKQMVSAMEISYDSARRWGKEPGFPYDGLIFRKSFERWWDARFRQKSRQRNLKHPQPSTAEKPEELIPLSGSSCALPPRAARIAKLAGFQM